MKCLIYVAQVYTAGGATPAPRTRIQVRIIMRNYAHTRRRENPKIPANINYHPTNQCTERDGDVIHLAAIAGALALALH